MRLHDWPSRGSRSRRSATSTSCRAVARASADILAAAVLIWTGALALAWLLYPLAYVISTLVRGSIVDWYPYPFVDASELGYGGVAWRCVVLALGMAVGAWVVAGAGNRLGQRRRGNA